MQGIATYAGAVIVAPTVSNQSGQLAAVSEICGSSPRGSYAVVVALNVVL